MQGLGVVVEPAVGRHDLFQGILPGMAEGRMAQIMGQGQGLAQVLVQMQIAADGTRDLRNLERMGQPGAEEIALVIDEHLGLVGQPPEGHGMDDAVPVALKGAAGGAVALRMQAPARGLRPAGIGRQRKGGIEGSPVGVDGFLLPWPG